MAENTPGCFGVPSVFSFKSIHCGNCIYFRDCRNESYRALKSAPESIAINHVLDQYAESVNVLTQKQISEFPSRVRKELELLLRRKMDVVIRSALVSGEFHLFRGQRPMRLAIELLPGGFTKRELKSEFVNRLGWSEKSAWPQVSWTWQLLLAMKVAIERSDRLIVHPGICIQNNN